jgi:hypothetical protein
VSEDRRGRGLKNIQADGRPFIGIRLFDDGRLS